MNLKRTISTSLLIAAFVFAPLGMFTQPALALGTGCVTSSPTSGTTVTVCLTNPSDGSTLSGDVPVTATVTLSSGAPRVQRMVFYLDGAYLLTDYQAGYAFTLPTRKWVDGSHNLAVEALMSTGFVSQRSSLDVIFNNGISTPPTNPNQFTPSTGSTPAPGVPFTVAVGGDGASGELNAGKVSDLIVSLNPNLFLYLGDVYEKGSKAEFYNWYGTPAINFGRFRTITNPTIGNHEYEGGVAPGYFDYWDNIPDYYSYDAGGWHFISLNSNSAFVPVGPTSAQYQWLQQDLAANAGKCTIAYYHHPLFNIGAEAPKTSMSDIWRLMAQNGVDIVLNGHDHDYQRWVPLDGDGQPDPNGITEFVAGAAGHGTQTISKSDPRVAYSAYTNPFAMGVLVLKLNPDGAHFSYRNIGGSVIDSGVIPCNPGVADTQPPSVPASLSATAVSATQINLAWAISSDNTAVAGYSIYRNGGLLATVPGSSLTYSDTSALPASSYSFSVDAFDQAGNHSVASAPAQATTPAMPPNLTFTPAADTYVNAGSPTSKYGTSTTMRADASPDLHAYLRFNVTGLGGTPITKATLKVRSNSNSSLGIKALAVADNSWVETSTTYNNAPALGSQLAASGAISSGSWATMDVTPYITGEGSFSFGLTTTSNSSLSFASRESGANAPQLLIDFQGAPADTQAPTVPAGLSAVLAGSQVNLSWSASTDNVGVTGYTVFRDGSPLTTVSGSSLSYNDTTIQPGNTYQYAVDAFDQAGNHSAASSPAVPVTVPPAQDTQAPSIPGGFTATAASATQVNLSWSASTDNVGVTGYTIFRDGSPLTTVSGSSMGFNDSSAQPASTYAYAVDAFDQAGNHSAASAPAQETTPAMPPNLTFTPAADTYVNAGSPTSKYGTSTTMRADASPDLHAYLRFNVTGLGGTPITKATLKVRSNSNSSLGIKALAVADNSWVETSTTYNNAPALGSQLAASGAISSGSWTTMDVTPYITGEGSFNFGLTTTSNSSLSFASRESGANAPQLLIDFQGAPADTQSPTVPAGLSAVLAGSQVNLSWSASTDNVGVTGYTIFRDGSPLTTVSGASLSYNDTTIQPGNTYQYAVDAFDQAGNHSAASSPAVSVTVPSAPDTQAPTVPAGLSAVLAGSKVNLSWSASTDNVGVTGYTIFRDGSPLTTVSGASLSYNDTTIQPGNTYQYAVDAFDQAGNHSAASSPAVSVTVPSAPDTQAPTVPAGLSAVLAGSKVNLSWSASTDNVGVTGYTVFRDGSPLTTVSGASLSYNDTTIQPGNTYQYAVDAFDQAGNHSAASSPAVPVTVPPAQDTQAPSIPGGFTATAASATQVNLAWSASTDDVGVTGYTIFRDGSPLTTVPGSSLSFNDTSAQPASTYAYAVDAFDQAGNHSAATAAQQVTTPAVPSSLTFLPDADTYVNAGSPASIYGKASALRVDASPDVHSYLRFSITGLGGKTVSQARLMIYANSSLSQGIRIMAVTDNTWGELTTSYNNAPALGSLLVSSGAVTTGTWITLDVTGYINGEGSFNLGVNTLSSTALSLAARESGANAPRLILDLQ